MLALCVTLLRTCYFELFQKPNGLPTHSIACAYRAQLADMITERIRGDITLRIARNPRVGNVGGKIGVKCYAARSCPASVALYHCFEGGPHTVSLIGGKALYCFCARTAARAQIKSGNASDILQQSIRRSCRLEDRDPRCPVQLVPAVR
jgi:hypothetical protein